MTQASMVKVHDVAAVVTETLSDGSKVYNVRIQRDPRYDISETVTIGALSEAHANNIASALNNGLAWIDCGESESATSSAGRI